MALEARWGLEVNGLRKLRPAVPLAGLGECPGVAKLSRRCVIVACLEDLFAKANGDYQQPCPVVVSDVLLVKYTPSDGEGR